jgi:hypothetical protein
MDLARCLNDLEVQVLLARIDEKVDALLVRRSDHEKRLRKVERNQWTLIPGATTLISVALAYVGRKLGL